MPERQAPPQRSEPTPQSASGRVSLLSTRNTETRGVDNWNPPSPLPTPDWANRPLNTGVTFGTIFGAGDPIPLTSVPNGVTTPTFLDGSPLGTLAELFSRFYSNAPVDNPDSPVIVGDTGTSSGSTGNMGLIVVLLLLGGVGYFIYKRYHKQ